jgi:hypothetical protein
VILSDAETPEVVPTVRIASPLSTMGVPPKPAPRSVNRNQALLGSVQKPIDDPDFISNVSGVSASRMAPKYFGDDKNVGISKRRKIKIICRKLIRVFRIACVSYLKKNKL